MNSGISCWVAPIAAANITHINTSVAMYFASNYVNLTDKRAALLDLLERIDGEKGKRLAIQYLYNDKNWIKRVPKFEQLINNTWNDKLLKRKGDSMYSTKSCFAVRTIWFYFVPMLLIVGSIGNCLSFVVLCQQKMRQTSTYVYLAALAVFDEMVLLTALLPLWLQNVFGWRIETISNGACQFMNAVGFVTSCTSVWIIVVVTIERLLVVRLPLRAGNFTSPQHALTIIFIVVSLFIFASTHFFFTTKLHHFKQDTKCELSSEIGNIVWNIVDGILYAYLPILSIVTLNVIILISLQRASIRRAALTSQQQLHGFKQMTCSQTAINSSTTAAQNCSPTSNRPSRAEENTNMVQLTRMLILVSGSFVATTLPVVVTRIINITNRFQKKKRNSNFDETLILFDTIADILMFVNHSINILLYCTKGAKFRSQLKRLFCRNSIDGPRDNGTFADMRTCRSMGVRDTSIALTTYRSPLINKDQQNP